ncbi:MAG: hypothetical protein H7175_28715 [Burkholderiales bacterium]|nr:hypothetical protein [Anaerolineae bacterium]
MTSNNQYPHWLYNDDGKLDEELAAQFIAERDSLIQHIETAFADVPYPGDANLTIKDGDFFANVAETRRDFRGKHWKDLSPEFIHEHPSALNIFTRRAYHFYLPAYMIGILLDANNGSLVSTQLLHDFVVGETNWVAVQLNEFSAEQCAAISAYLKFHYLLFDKFDLRQSGDYVEQAIMKLETNG